MCIHPVDASSTFRLLIIHNDPFGGFYKIITVQFIGKLSIIVILDKIINIYLCKKLGQFRSPG